MDDSDQSPHSNMKPLTRIKRKNRVTENNSLSLEFLKNNKNKISS